MSIISLPGRVELNGQVVTDFDVDLDTIPGDPIEIRVTQNMMMEALVQLLEANQDAIDRSPT